MKPVHLWLLETYATTFFCYKQILIDIFWNFAPRILFRVVLGELEDISAFEDFSYTWNPGYDITQNTPYGNHVTLIPYGGNMYNNLQGNHGNIMPYVDDKDTPNDDALDLEELRREMPTPLSSYSPVTCEDESSLFSDVSKTSKPLIVAV